MYLNIILMVHIYTHSFFLGGFKRQFQHSMEKNKIEIIERPLNIFLM